VKKPVSRIIGSVLMFAVLVAVFSFGGGIAAQAEDVELALTDVGNTSESVAETLAYTNGNNELIRGQLEFLLEMGIDISALSEYLLQDSFGYDIDLGAIRNELSLSPERQAEVKNEFKSVLSVEAGALLDDIYITEQFQNELEQILEISGLMQQSLASGSANGLFAEIQQEITAGKTYRFAIPVENVTDFDGLEYTFSYNPTDFQLVDACGLTSGKETVAGLVNGTEINITGISNGEVIFERGTEVAVGKSRSGVVNIVTLKALRTSTATVSSSVEEINVEPSFVRIAVSNDIGYAGLMQELAAAFEATYPQYIIASMSMRPALALTLGKDGVVDLCFTNSLPLEEALIDDGFGLSRTEIMYNRFIAVGPKNVTYTPPDTLVNLFQYIYNNNLPFLSGTYAREAEIWAAAGIANHGYGSSGYETATVLQFSALYKSYCLVDDAMWLKSSDDLFIDSYLKQVTQDEDYPLGINQHSVIMINPEAEFLMPVTTPINDAGAQAFVDWLLTEDAQEIIDGFEINEQQVYTHNASL